MGINESMIKKGGTKPAPTTPRPNVTPGGQIKPPSPCVPPPPQSTPAPPPSNGR